jgi:hypothetical protein
VLLEGEAGAGAPDAVVRLLSRRDTTHRKRLANPVFSGAAVSAMLLAEEEFAQWEGSDRRV